MTNDDDLAAAMQTQGQALRQLARSILRATDGADDVVQDACVAALASRTAPTHATSWLAHIVRNFALRRLRDHNRRGRIDAATAAEPAFALPADAMPAELEVKTGIKLDQFLASLGGEYGVVITFDETRKVPVPLGPGQTVEIAEPGIMFVARVKDDTIFNHVDQMMKNNPQVIRVEKDGVRMRTMPLPLPLPIQLRPTLARSGDYLFFASSEEMILGALAVKSGKGKALKSTDEFKRLSQGIPANGTTSVL